MKPLAIYLYGADFGPLDTDFESAYRRLESLERMHVELDGSFVWSGREGSTAWRIDGMLYDAGGRLQYVELKGRCPSEAWDRLVAVFAPARSPLCVLDLTSHRRRTLGEFHEETWLR